MFRTSKCNHNERGRCLHCLAQQAIAQKKVKKEKEEIKVENKCSHPATMQCLHCMKSAQKTMEEEESCKHPDFQSCIRCKKVNSYESFENYLNELERNCLHKKPCRKCVPPQSRKTFFVDKNCKNHLPYPQAQCDACMAPTLTLAKQSYSHVQKVVIRTQAIYRIVDADIFGILLGSVKDDIVYVDDVYFPDEQIPKSGFLDPFILASYIEVFEYFGLKQVGLIYSSPFINGMGLMVSAMFQQQMTKLYKGHHISQFITMRLNYDDMDPYFQCFMVSDQFQALHRHGIVFEKEENSNYFDLITAKSEKDKGGMPTFLRDGVETEEYFYKEVIVWVETVYQEGFFYEDKNIVYPMFTLDHQGIEQFQIFINTQVSHPEEKYRSIQFLLHFDKIFGRKDTMLFLENFLFCNPDFYLHEKLKDYKEIIKKQDSKLTSFY